MFVILTTYTVFFLSSDTRNLPPEPAEQQEEPVKVEDKSEVNMEQQKQEQTVKEKEETVNEVKKITWFVIYTYAVNHAYMMHTEVFK